MPFVTCKVYQAVKWTNAGQAALADLLEAIERFMDHLHVYTKISPTGAMDEIILKIMVELLSTLALVTKQIKQKQPRKSRSLLIHHCRPNTAQ